MLNKLLEKHEFYLAATIIVLMIFITSINSAFFTVANLFDLIKSSLVMGIFALGTFLVIVSGEIDVSFPAIAVVSMYVTSKLFNAIGFESSITAAFLLAALIGIALGLFNGFFVSTFNVPTLIVTLGTQNLFRGFLLAFVGTEIINNLPQSFNDFSRMDLMSVRQGRLIYGLPVSFLILVAAIIVTWFIVRYTKIGRGIFAIGGAPEAAKRVGFEVKKIKYFIYAYSGMLAGLAGIVHASIIRAANPFDIVGIELNVIAAVILGGASIKGGKGSILGTLLGVGLIVMINNSLILMGVSSYWQRFVIGIVIIVSIGITEYRNRRGEKSYG